VPGAGGDPGDGDDPGVGDHAARRHGPAHRAAPRAGVQPSVGRTGVGERGGPGVAEPLRADGGAGSGHDVAADPEDQGPEDAGKDPSDPRVTSWFASFCRKHSIDELPQLWHVMRGEMSLVGPRPLTQSEIDRYYSGDASELLSVKPGLTGLWQIYGRSAIRFPRRAVMDLELVRSLTARTYFKILVRTIPAIIRGNGAW